MDERMNWHLKMGKGRMGIGSANGLPSGMGMSQSIFWRKSAGMEYSFGLNLAMLPICPPILHHFPVFLLASN